MSMKVELADFVEKAAGYGNGFLLTSGWTKGPHATHVRLTYRATSDGVQSICQAGRTARANIAANPNVTLLWAPLQTGGYSLIADGLATAAEEGPVTIEITSAVLHRPAE